ncbi:hypothetical protein AGMMS50239_38310 [Bacteroidia bacterium]|nr:hypothetical protein AGMMS50239_38310 [Bacteroidia bacterium]GHV31683.1 hypothetical protein FACS1894177_06730 [Bacteroidia bacterium]
MADSESGELRKLKFTAYSDVKFEKKLEHDPYIVMLNPEDFKRNFNIAYNGKQPTGSTSSEKKYSKSEPETYSFDFIVDGTGVINGIKTDVTKNIEHFLSVVYNYYSKEHRPPYVVINYCELILKCVLTTLSISYTLFHPNGYPLRAKITCSFNAVKSAEVEAKELDKQSPDITHKRVLKESELLIAISNTIYESNKYYIDVAEKNNLNNFRKIKPGTALYFPPLKN